MRGGWAGVMVEPPSFWAGDGRYMAEVAQRDKGWQGILAILPTRQGRCRVDTASQLVHWAQKGLR